MRQAVLDQIRRASPQGLGISNELPYQEGDTGLFVKNPKTIYVDSAEVDLIPLFDTLDGQNFNLEQSIVRIYFTTDAKKPIANYDQVLNQLRSLKNSIEYPGATRRETTVSTSYEGDLLVTELVYRLTKLN
jgi:hypothetical protein